MQPFRRVEDKKAGSTALGILVPPGQRTLVILRPRALLWDLLPCRLEPETGLIKILDFARDEAAGLARQIQRHLEQQARSQHKFLEVQAQGTGFHVCFFQDAFLWLTCLRRPGHPYLPMVFSDSEEAHEAARKIAIVLCPGADANQEFYFNTQHFSW